MRRREGGREGEVIPRVWDSTVATEAHGMLGNLNPLGDGPDRSLADHGARVPEVLPAAELEGDIGAYFLCWCLLFVLIRQGLMGGSGPQRLIRALGEETGNIRCARRDLLTRCVLSRWARPQTLRRGVTPPIFFLRLEG